MRDVKFLTREHWHPLAHLLGYIFTVRTGVHTKSYDLYSLICYTHIHLDLLLFSYTRRNMDAPSNILLRSHLSTLISHYTDQKDKFEITLSFKHANYIDFVGPPQPTTVMQPLLLQIIAVPQSLNSVS